MELILPAPKQRANWRGQTRWENVPRDKYFNDCSVLTSLAVMRRVRDLPFKHALVDVHIQTINRYDLDNLVALLKWPFDWLKARAILPDDNAQKLWWKSMPTQEMYRRKDRKLFLTLYPVTEEEVFNAQTRK